MPVSVLGAVTFHTTIDTLRSKLLHDTSIRVSAKGVWLLSEKFPKQNLNTAASTTSKSYKRIVKEECNCIEHLKLPSSPPEVEENKNSFWKARLADILAVFASRLHGSKVYYYKIFSWDFL